MKSTNTDFYKKAYERYGISAKGVHWLSTYTQEKRFEILLSFIKNDLSNSSIIDVGCGFGDLLCYLDKNKIPFKTYTGIDCEKFMLEICRKRFNAKFKKINILTEEIPNGNYLICSGTFNTFKNSDFLCAIKRCFEKSTIGFSFNFITKTSIHTLTNNEIFNFCKNLSKEIYIKEDYLNNDCSIFLKK